MEVLAEQLNRPQVVMNRHDFEQKQYEISVQAGTNQRYHQDRAWLWTWLDRSCKIAVGVIAVIGVCLAIVTIFVQRSDWIAASVTAAALAALFAIALNVSPFGDWASLHIALFQRWTDLREDVDGLLYDLEGEPTRENMDRLRQLEAKAHRICGTEPSAKLELLVKYQADEERSRHPSSAACAG